jgi:hypothetical protein
MQLKKQQQISTTAAKHSRQTAAQMVLHGAHSDVPISMYAVLVQAVDMSTAVSLVPLTLMSMCAPLEVSTTSSCVA